MAYGPRTERSLAPSVAGVTRHIGGANGGRPLLAALAALPGATGRAARYWAARGASGSYRAAF